MGGPARPLGARPGGPSARRADRGGRRRAGAGAGQLAGGRCELRCGHRGHAANLLGGAGANAADFAMQTLGVGAWMVAGLMLVLGLTRAAHPVPDRPGPRCAGARPPKPQNPKTPKPRKLIIE